MLKHVEKAFSRDDTDIQLLLFSRLGSAFSRLMLGEALCILSLSSAGLWRERHGRREVMRTSAGRKRAVWMECLQWDGSSQMGHRKHQEGKWKEEKEEDWNMWIQSQAVILIGSLLTYWWQCEKARLKSVFKVFLEGLWPTSIHSISELKCRENERRLENIDWTEWPVLKNQSSLRTSSIYKNCQFKLPALTENSPSPSHGTFILFHAGWFLTSSIPQYNIRVLRSHIFSLACWLVSTPWDPVMITLTASDLHRATCLEVVEAERQYKKDMDLSRST